MEIPGGGGEIGTSVIAKSIKYILKINSFIFALAGTAQWIECQPANQRITGSIPGQDTCRGCGRGPW